jgi:HlyD family secretion protein
MQIDANVAEADVGVVKIDQNVDFTVDAFPMETFHGKVVQVRNAPITVQNVVTYDTVIGVSNPELKLKPGMTANVSIIVAHKADALQIKNAAPAFWLGLAAQDRSQGRHWDGSPVCSVRHCGHASPTKSLRNTRPPRTKQT